VNCAGGAAWRSLARGPTRADFGSFLHLSHDKLVFFGGMSGSQYHNDVWIYSIDANTWQELHCVGASPTPRSRHTSDIWNSFLIVYGGSQASNESFDPAVYLLDVPNRHWHVVAPSPGMFFPSGVRDHGAVVLKDSYYVYGGKKSRNEFADPVLLRLHLDMVNPKDENSVIVSSGASGNVFSCGFAGHGALGVGKVISFD
jgi:hypothetical protein